MLHRQGESIAEKTVGNYMRQMGIKAVSYTHLQTQVAPGERLSDHVYEYDAKEHELFRSDRAEERAKQKEEKRDNRYERVSVKEKLAEKKDAVIKMNAGKEHSAPEKKKEAVI